MEKSIALISLGCAKNLVDSETILGSLKSRGFKIINNVSDADAVVINTCGFISDAAEESVNTILETAEIVKETGAVLIAAGCMAQRYKHQIKKLIPEIDIIIGINQIPDAGLIIAQALGEKQNKILTKENTQKRLVSTKGYAYLKIAEGCNNRCSYCTIPDIRGPLKSKSIEDVIKETEFLAACGIKEIIIIAQDTTAYGIDLYGKRMLTELLSKISNVNGVEWIRVLYSYPDAIDNTLISEISSNDKIVNYLDIPVQHSSGKILNLMGRKSDEIKLEKLFNTIQNSIKDVILRTTVITGFPGETEEDFNNLTAFIKRIRFDRLGVFKYSCEENTPAAKFQGQISKTITNKRYSEIMKIQKEISYNKNKGRIGQVYKTIIEGISDDGIFYKGRSYGESPDVDGKIFFTARDIDLNKQFVNVKILDAQEYDLIGDVVDEFTK